MPRVLEDRQDDLINTALELQESGLNYRGFLVGSCAVAIAGGRRLFLLEGANNSPVRGVPRDCGEMGVLEQARDIEEQLGLGSVMLQSLYVAGPGDLDEISRTLGRDADTMPPCAECRSLLVDSSHTTPDLLITTVANDRPLRVEQRTLDALNMEFANFVAPPPSRELAAVG